MLAMVQILDQTLVRMRQSTPRPDAGRNRPGAALQAGGPRRVAARSIAATSASGSSGAGSRPPLATASGRSSSATIRTSAPSRPAPDGLARRRLRSKKNARPSAEPPPQSAATGSRNRPAARPTRAATAAWQQTLAEIGDMTADFAAKAERVAISGPNRLVVSFRKAYTQAQQYCERPERRQKLEETFSRLAGRTIRIDFATLPDEPAAQATARLTGQRPSRPPTVANGNSKCDAKSADSQGGRAVRCRNYRHARPAPTRLKTPKARTRSVSGGIRKPTVTRA